MSLGEYDTEILLQTSKAIGLDSKYKWNWIYDNDSLRFYTVYPLFFGSEIQETTTMLSILRN
jgi:hypothetical protein